MQVTLDLAELRQWYPGLTPEVISDDVLNALWGQACSFVGSTDSDSFAPYDPEAQPPVIERKFLLYSALCHLATLATRGDQPGRVASASEGSVSTSFDLIKTQSQLAQWWNLTPCGATFWACTTKYRLGGRLFGQSGFHPWG